jgi:hypothetical protein
VKAVRVRLFLVDIIGCAPFRFDLRRQSHRLARLVRAEMMRDEQADQVQTKKLQSGDVQKQDDIHPTMKRAKVWRYIGAFFPGHSGMLIAPQPLPA